jgi:2,3-dihydroxyphenylpropionate 1,2-dioxygenase
MTQVVQPMAEIVFGIGASHTTLMNTQWDKVDHLARAHEFRNALAQARDQLAETKPDLVVIVGSNHFRGQWLDLMPSFLIGVDEVCASGEHGTPKGLLNSNQAAAQFICDSVVANDFDLAFSTHMAVDHGISHAVQWLLADSNTAVVPIVVNCFAPPLPSIRRVLDLGSALRDILQALPDVDRVAVIGTGGLSHSLPFPDWRRPQSDDDEFLVDSWRNGRGHWERYEARRRNLIVNAPPVINEVFDQNFLKALEDGEAREFAESLNDDQLVEVAGNGGNEIRAWLMMAACMGHQSAEILSYSAMPEWLTGMAVAFVDPSKLIA